MTNMLKIDVVIEHDRDGYIAYSNNSKSCTIIGKGKSVREAKADYINSMAETIDFYLQKGDRIPDELLSLPIFIDKTK
jgi:hypothetical protein